MTMMEEARDDARISYENMLQKVKIQDSDQALGDHVAGKYLSTGFAEGYGHGYRTNAGAAHAGLSVVIGEIDAGLIDLDTAKEKLISLRDAIKEAAGL